MSARKGKQQIRDDVYERSRKSTWLVCFENTFLVEFLDTFRGFSGYKMDLNILVNENGLVANENYIQKRIYRAFHGKHLVCITLLWLNSNLCLCLSLSPLFDEDRFTTVALNTVIEGDKVKNVPPPLCIISQNPKIKIYNRLTVKISQNMQIFNLVSNLLCIISLRLSSELLIHD